MKRITKQFSFTLLTLLAVAAIASGCKEKPEAQQVEEKARTSAEKAGDALKDAATKTGEAIKDTAGKTWDATKEQTQKLAGEVKEGIQQGAQKAGEFATNVAGAIKQEAAKVGTKTNKTNP